MLCLTITAIILIVIGLVSAEIINQVTSSEHKSGDENEDTDIQTLTDLDQTDIEPVQKNILFDESKDQYE